MSQTAVAKLRLALDGIGDGGECSGMLHSVAASLSVVSLHHVFALQFCAVLCIDNHSCGYALLLGAIGAPTAVSQLCGSKHNDSARISHVDSDADGALARHNRPCGAVCGAGSDDATIDMALCQQDACFYRALRLFAHRRWENSVLVDEKR